MKRLIQYFDSVGKIAGALATVVALISGGIALYYVLRPPPPAKAKRSSSRTSCQSMGRRFGSVITSGSLG